jgi:NADH dehydrogenase FAD-containing subunit
MWQLRSAFPTNHALRRRRGQRHLAQYFQAEVVGVDFGARKIRSDAEPFSYDYLILAPDSRTAYFGASGAEEKAIDFKGLQDALRVRNTTIDRFEEAERLRGGPHRTGTELAYHVLEALSSIESSHRQRTMIEIESDCERPKPLSYDKL